MEIGEIKSRLTMAAVLSHYGLKPTKNRLCCPFHADRTPSMQIYPNTQTAYCFSAACPTHGKSLDVISFIAHKESCSVGDAIQKAKELLGYSPQVALVQDSFSPGSEAVSREEFLGELFSYFVKVLPNSGPAKTYLASRQLSGALVTGNALQGQIGYCRGEYHWHKEQAFLDRCVGLGLLVAFGKNQHQRITYQPVGRQSIVFALRNEAAGVSGLYFRSILHEPTQRHSYLKGGSGLYPSYPAAATKRLILTESVIDAATLLQEEEITKSYSILACYGTNRLTEEHVLALVKLVELEEIIFAFDSDAAGQKAVIKYALELRELLPGVKLTTLQLPEGEDVNSVAVSHQAGVFTYLLANRVGVNGVETVLGEQPLSPCEPEPTEPERPIQVSTPQAGREESDVFDSTNPEKLVYRTRTAVYSIVGGVSKGLDSLKVTLVIEKAGQVGGMAGQLGSMGSKVRSKVDLYEEKQVGKLSSETSERLALRPDMVQADLYRLTDLVETYRENQQSTAQKTPQNPEPGFTPLTLQERSELESFGKEGNLLKRLNELLGKSGIVGEEENRLFLLLIAASYKLPETLHALIQGSSGSGKTRLLKQISDCIPQEKVTRLTRVSDKVLYNYPETYFMNRLLCLEDVDGLSEEAEFAFRELQSNGELNSSTSIKLENGQIIAGQKTVRGPIASLACTTKGEIYEDNMSRVFLLAVDESSEQTQRIIAYQNQQAAGLLDRKTEQDTRQFIQRFIRFLEPLEVVNPFANQLHLPKEAHKIRRLNALFQSFVKMITVFHQCQRQKDDRGRLISELCDIETAIEIMFESILLKVDELDGSLRQFYEQLKAAIAPKGKQYQFSRFEVKEAIGLGKTQQQAYLNRLVELEYIQQYGFANRGFTYKIVQWDNYKALRNRIKTDLRQQVAAIYLDRLKTPLAERQAVVK